MAFLKKELEGVRAHRQSYRRRRQAAEVPVIAIVGYTNAGKSTLINRLSNSGVLAEDKLFATLDPTTRKMALPLGKQRGVVYRYAGLPVIVTYAPTILLRATADKAKAWADLCLALDVRAGISP